MYRRSAVRQLGIFSWRVRNGRAVRGVELKIVEVTNSIFADIRASSPEPLVRHLTSTEQTHSLKVWQPFTTYIHTGNMWDINDVWDMFSASNNAIFALLIPQWVSLKYLVFVSIFPLFDLSRSFTISCCLTCEQQARRMSILQKYSKQKIVGQRVLRPFSIHNVKWLCMFKTTEQVFPYMLKKLITWQKQELTMWLLQAYVQWGKNILLEASHLILLP